MVKFQMPTLRPVLIPTNQGGFTVLQKIKVWLTQARKFELAEDWQFSREFEPNKLLTIVIPKGFIFDGASIPRMLWFVLNPYGILMIPGLLHDYYYKYESFIVLRVKDPQVVSVTSFVGRGQKFADELFRDVAFEVNGMKVLTTIAYLALRFCGFVAWNNHRKAEEFKIDD